MVSMAHRNSGFIDDLPIKNGDFPSFIDDLPIKNGDFPSFIDGLPIKNGDFPSFIDGLPGFTYKKWWIFPLCKVIPSWSFFAGDHVGLGGYPTW